MDKFVGLQPVFDFFISQALGIAPLQGGDDFQNIVAGLDPDQSRGLIEAPVVLGLIFAAFQGIDIAVDQSIDRLDLVLGYQSGQQFVEQIDGVGSLALVEQHEAVLALGEQIVIDGILVVQR